MKEALNYIMHNINMSVLGWHFPFAFFISVCYTYFSLNLIFEYPHLFQEVWQKWKNLCDCIRSIYFVLATYRLLLIEYLWVNFIGWHIILFWSNSVLMCFLYTISTMFYDHSSNLSLISYIFDTHYFGKYERKCR